MIIVLNKNVDSGSIEQITEKIKEKGLEPLIMPGVEKTVIGAIGDERLLEELHLENFTCVEKIMRVLTPYKIVSRDFQNENTVISLDGISIGGDQFAVMAGPCAIENEDQFIQTARAAKRAGAHILRAGLFKPRSSPYSFQGLGRNGLQIIKTVKQEIGIPIVSEILSPYDIDVLVEDVDILQVGARNMYNYDLLKALGKVSKPVMLKRGLSASIDEFLMSAEYIMIGGNEKVILCERGIRTFEKATRNTLDLAAIAYIKERVHLPIISDPSHGTGERSLVFPMAMASVAAGADGLMVETHINPEKALSDGAQSLFPEEFEHLMQQLSKLLSLYHKSLQPISV
jgi:3-deoxy-7-phosphoheptulonate synthase